MDKTVTTKYMRVPVGYGIFCMFLGGLLGALLMFALVAIDLIAVARRCHV